MKLDILCDMDSILVDLMEPWLAAYNKDIREPTSPLFRLSDCKSWDLEKLVPEGTAIFKPLGYTHFFKNLKPLPGALEGLKQMLKEGHNVIVVTSASQASASDKIAWMHEHAPFMRGRMMIAVDRTDKSAIGGDVLIDDGPHNLESFKARYPNSLTVAIEYPYNEHTYASGACDHLLKGHDDGKAWSLIPMLVRGYMQRTRMPYRERVAERRSAVV